MNMNKRILNDASYIYALKHIVGPWHQYDFILATNGYGWDYILESANYLTNVDLMNVGTISITSSTDTYEYIQSFREHGESILFTPELQKEESMLGVGGMSKVLDGIPLKVVWMNQTNVIRIMTPLDDEDCMIRYMESIIRRNFESADCLKRGDSEIKEF